MQIERKLAELGYELPPPAQPMARYRWAVRTGNLYYLSGHGAALLSVPQWVGKVGREVTVQQGYEANRFVGLRILSTLKQELGDLDRIVRPVFQLSYVNCVPDLEEDYFIVGDGSVDLWIALWGDAIGRCAGMTLGVVDLPKHLPTAISSLWEVREGIGGGFPAL